MFDIREKLVISCLIFIAIFSATNGLNASVTLSKRVLNGENQDTLPIQVIADENSVNITLYDALLEAQNKSESFIINGTLHPEYGFLIVSIGGLANNPNENLFWFVYLIDGSCERSLETGVSSTLISDDQHYLFWYKPWVTEDNNINVTLSKWIKDDKLNNDTIDVHLVKNDTCVELTLYDALKHAAISNNNYTFTTKNSDSEIESLGGLNESQTESLYWRIFKLKEDGEQDLGSGLSQKLVTGEKYAFWYRNVPEEPNSAFNRWHHCSVAINLFLFFLLSFALNA